MDQFLVLQITAEIPIHERTIRRTFAYQPIIERRQIIGYRLRQRFFPHKWYNVHMLTDFELIAEIKRVYEYLTLKYV